METRSACKPRGGDKQLTAWKEDQLQCTPMPCPATATGPWVIKNTSVRVRSRMRSEPVCADCGEIINYHIELGQIPDVAVAAVVAVVSWTSLASPTLLLCFWLIFSTAIVSPFDGFLFCVLFSACCWNHPCLNDDEGQV